MKNVLAGAAAALLLVSCGGRAEPVASGQWSSEKAWEWYNAQPWIVGCNFVPSYAINQFEFWQKETFDPQVIDDELGLAESIGFNTVRIYLHERLWYADKEGFKSRINQFFDIAEKHGIRCIVTFFTNGGNHKIQFELGPQPEAIPGVHNSNWIPSPGKAVVENKEEWPKLKEYVQDILRSYAHDKRILYWCLCNEPENFKNGIDVKEFMPEVYRWAWEVRPDQPLSSPEWALPGKNPSSTKLDIVSFVCQNSDILTFHCYSKPDEVRTFIKMLSRFDRPMVCQEYMARTSGSTFQGVMPVLKENHVGAINWGLVNGKCHFHLPWGHKDGDPEPELWFHDIFRPDYSPFDPAEIEFIKEITADKK